jgi:hypothetical protein
MNQYALGRGATAPVARKRVARMRAASIALAVATAAAAAALGSVPAQAATGVQFEPKAEYETGKAPEGIATGDLNGDGKPDLVVANKEDSTVSVLINKGNGTFPAPVPYSTGLGPDAVALGDLGNGHLDIVTANATESTVSVLLGNGNGTFTPPSEENKTGAHPVAVAVGDLNGDGKADIVTANGLSGTEAEPGTVSILLGEGNGKFAKQQQIAVGPAKVKGPAGVAIADLNGDGKPDIVVTNPEANSVSVLINEGEKEGKLVFREAEYKLGLGPAQTGTGPVGIAVADLTGNGVKDIVTANEKAGTVSVLLGRGDGTFEEPKEFKAGKKARAVAVTDLSGDGKPDIATANASKEANSVTVLLGKGDGTFATKGGEFSVGTEPRAIALADFNGDGKPDIATANFGANTASVLLDANVGVLSVSPGSLSFPAQLFGTTGAAQGITVTNAGAAPLSVSGVTVAGKAASSFSAAGCASTTLAVGASCSVAVGFKPNGYGELKAEATVATSVASKVLKLVGTGLPPAAQVTTEPVSEIAGTYVTLGGRTVSQGPGSFYFQYGPTTSYGSSTPALPLSSSFSAQVLAATLSLPPGRYHFRLVAVNLAGTSYGGDEAFAIPPESPLVRLLKHGHLASVLKHGLRVQVSDPDGASTVIRVRLLIDAATARAARLASTKGKSKKKVLVGSARVVTTATGVDTVTVHFTSAARRRLAGVGHFKLTVTATPATPSGVLGEVTTLATVLRR